VGAALPPDAHAQAPLVALLTDFGTADGYVGVMKAVILGIAPGVPLVDLTHEIPPRDIRAGAWVLHTSWRALPAGSVCLGVVDPGVGTARRAVAFAAGERFCVGPDNGLFGYLLAVTPASAAVALDNPRYQLPSPSATFQGRDIFAPAAGHLAAGLPLAALGSAIAPESLTALALRQPVRQGDDLVGQILHVDHYGNLITDIGQRLAAALLARVAPDVPLRVGQHAVTAAAQTFADGPAGEPFALVDSSGHLAVALRDGSAAARLGVGVGTEVRVAGGASLLPHE
jgi:hypothetical protein